MEPKDWALVLGIVAVVLAGFLLFGGLGRVPEPAAPVAPATLPLEVAGFAVQERLDRVDPIFAGERYSSLMFLSPDGGSRWAAGVSRVTVMVYRFEAVTHAEAAMQILSLGNPLVEQKLQNRDIWTQRDAESGQATLFWVSGPSLVQILAVGTTPADLEAAVAAGTTVLGAVMHSPERPA